MSYTRATLAEFVAIYPEFEAVTQAQYDYWAARAECVATDDFGDDQVFVAAAMTAHYLALQGLGTSIDAQRAGKFGGANKVKSGSLELGWDASGTSSSSVTSTRYGASVWPLIKAYKGGPRITDTGTTCFVPAGYPYGIA